MSDRRSLKAVALAAGLASLPVMSAWAVPSPGLASMQGGASATLQLVDARTYHHCHNMPRRTRCHSKARLPVNWPPNTNTPGTSRLRDTDARKTGCWGWFCRR